MDETGFWGLAVLAAALVGMGKGGLPVVGMMSVPVLAFAVPPVVATAILAPVYVVSDMFGLWAYRRDFDRRVVAIMAAGATLGVALGWATARIVPEAAVTLMIGLIGAVFALRLIWQSWRGRVPPPRPAHVGPGVFWGAVTGFTSFVSHAGAPPFQVYALPLRMNKARFAGTTTVLFAYVNAIKLVPYWALGALNWGNMSVSLRLLVPAAAAVFLGVWLVRVLPERVFFGAVVWALLLISLRLIWVALV
ncbi:MAG: sulfite exporter TauE/SafE family protein [Paracoccus sp. (in: a-proteobacteria)]|uniref:sulfite exporter TauE/SafE family protein n=1 Tax=Paracoccus sp. TaxID=267 RepID=UPI0026DF0F5F|nr:sulfite exporter TauE/SafE family protein [Paracoccus sp. (in: a-proteobacteria)]MDO5631439.1 sulfite exporter TauE/SafE family protein [Paracoccus sp. (in: a-proteobacteria)]